MWCILVSGLHILQVGNLPKRVRSCQSFNKLLGGQGFGGIGVCLTLADHNPDLRCDNEEGGKFIGGNWPQPKNYLVLVEFGVSRNGG